MPLTFLQVSIDSFEQHATTIAKWDLNVARSWNYATGPLDESIGVERVRGCLCVPHVPDSASQLSNLCAVLRDMVSGQHSVFDFTKMKDGAQNLLDVYSKRLEELRSREASTGLAARS